MNEYKLMIAPFHHNGFRSLSKKQAEEYQAELKQFPEWMHDSISKKRFSVRTLAIITDISFYFAETFIKHNPMVRWGYFTKPKNEVSVNMPVLLGFKSNMKLDPRRIVSVCASESFEQHDKNRLRNAYRTWTKYTAEATPNIADVFSSIRERKI